MPSNCTCIFSMWKVKASHNSVQVQHVYESYILLEKNPALSDVQRYVLDSLLKLKHLKNVWANVARKKEEIWKTFRQVFIRVILYGSTYTIKTFSKNIYTDPFRNIYKMLYNMLYTHFFRNVTEKPNINQFKVFWKCFCYLGCHPYRSKVLPVFYYGSAIWRQSEWRREMPSKIKLADIS